MSRCESGRIVFVWGDGFPIELEPGVKVIDEVIEIFLKYVV